MGRWILLPWLIDMNQNTNSFFKVIKSFRFNILVVLLLFSIIPIFLFKSYAIHLYEENEISTRQDKIYNMAYMIKNLLISTDYLNNNTSEAVGIELEQLTSVYSGRIIIVDSNYIIIKDTYVVDEKKTCISKSVIECFEGNEINNYDDENSNIEIAFRFSGSDDKEGVAYFNFTTSDIEKNIKNLNTILNEIMVVLWIVMICISIIYMYSVSKPLIKMNEDIHKIKTGDLDYKLSTSGYTEIAKIDESFNDILLKLKNLDNSRQEFVSNVSHELKTPITSIKVLADSLLEQEGLPAEVYREFMGDIVEEIDRENQIITDLLNLVKMDKHSDSLNITSVNINELIDKVLKRLKPIAAKKNIEIVFESFRQVVASVDEVKMNMVITNLVENAVKYNVMDGWVRVSLNLDLKYFYIKIEDSGIGIPEEDQSKVFDRFFRVDKARSRETGGTGLGLAITQQAVNLHNGDIKVYSVEGEGTTFTIRIPIAYSEK